MSQHLDALSQLATKAKVRARSDQLRQDLQEAGRRLKQTEAEYEQAKQKLDELRDRQRALDANEEKFRELQQELAQFRTHLSEEEVAHAEENILAFREELKSERQALSENLPAVEQRKQSLQEELCRAVEAYREVRKTWDQLELEDGPDLCDDEAVLRRALRLFPREALKQLIEEVQAGAARFGRLSRNEQYAQLKVWIGTFRLLQWQGFAEADAVRAARTFGTMRDLSEHYRPGNIEAFRKDFETDWELWLREAQVELECLLEHRRRNERADHERREKEQAEEEKRREMREAGERALADVQDLVFGGEVSSRDRATFHEGIQRAMQGLGAGDERLLETVAPFADLLEGPEFRAIRRHLDRMAEKDGDSKLAEFSAENRDLIEQTRGLRAMIIGGDSREAARQQLEDAFEFEELEWVDYETNHPAKLKSLKDRVRNRKVDLVLILKSYIAHHVPEQLRPLCEANDVPCLMVEQGYGLNQVLQSLREGLVWA